MTDTNEPASEQTNEPDERPSRPPRRRRFLPLLLLGGVGAAVLSLAPHWPRERSVDFRIEGDRSEVRGLDVTWARVGAEREVVGGSSFRFEPGRAPQIVRMNVSLPDGLYALDITLERVDRNASIQRTLTLTDTTQITVPLR